MEHLNGRCPVFFVAQNEQTHLFTPTVQICSNTLSSERGIDVRIRDFKVKLLTNSLFSLLFGDNLVRARMCPHTPETAEIIKIKAQNI